jgi:hypothetical protein
MNRHSRTPMEFPWTRPSTSNSLTLEAHILELYLGEHQKSFRGLRRSTAEPAAASTESSSTLESQRVAFDLARLTLSGQTDHAQP